MANTPYLRRTQKREISQCVRKELSLRYDVSAVMDESCTAEEGRQMYLCCSREQKKDRHPVAKNRLILSLCSSHVHSLSIGEKHQFSHLQKCELRIPAREVSRKAKGLTRSDSWVSSPATTATATEGSAEQARPPRARTSTRKKTKQSIRMQRKFEPQKQTHKTSA